MASQCDHPPQGERGRAEDVWKQEMPGSAYSPSSRSPASAIDEAMIHRVVHRFYERARDDELLGPVFDRHVDDWPTHLATMVDFYPWLGARDE